MFGMGISHNTASPIEKVFILISGTRTFIEN